MPSLVGNVCMNFIINVGELIFILHRNTIITDSVKILIHLNHNSFAADANTLYVIFFHKQTVCCDLHINKHTTNELADLKQMIAQNNKNNNCFIQFAEPTQYLAGWLAGWKQKWRGHVIHTIIFTNKHSCVPSREREWANNYHFYVKQHYTYASPTVVRLSFVYIRKTSRTNAWHWFIIDFPMISFKTSNFRLACE